MSEYQDWWDAPYEPTQFDSWSWEDRNYQMAFYADDGYADNMPCDNSGYCAGTSCSQYWKCKGE